MQRTKALGAGVAVFALGALTPDLATAQTAPAGGAQAAPAPAAPTQGAPAGGTSYIGGAVAPPPAGTFLGGGNATGSSSRPLTGPNDRDGFDLGQSGESQGTVRGNPNGSYAVDTKGSLWSATGVHNVRKGDTLWAICDGYFHNPYQWPRIWSYNPQIQNPHWIYPGDQVRLRAPGEVEPEVGTPNQRGMSLVDRRRTVVPGTIFLRNQGFLEDEDQQTWGEITGAREDKMFLTDFDEAYIKIVGERDVKLGQELTVFRPLDHAGENRRIVEVQGTVRVDFYDASKKIARGRIVEALDTIERGARVGPLPRKIDVVGPRRNDTELTANIISSIQPHILYGSNQVVLLDKGDKEGLRPGNRLFILRRGDAFHNSLTTRSSGRRIAIEKNEVAQDEPIVKPSDSTELPDEVIAEVRVVNVREHTSTGLVTSARREIEKDDVAFARKGY